MSKFPRYTIFKYKTLTGLFSRFFAIFLDNLFFFASRARLPVARRAGPLRLCETK